MRREYFKLSQMIYFINLVFSCSNCLFDLWKRVLKWKCLSIAQQISLVICIEETHIKNIVQNKIHHITIYAASFYNINERWILSRDAKIFICFSAQGWFKGLNRDKLLLTNKSITAVHVTEIKGGIIFLSCRSHVKMATVFLSCGEAQSQSVLLSKWPVKTCVL